MGQAGDLRNSGIKQLVREWPSPFTTYYYIKNCRNTAETATYYTNNVFFPKTQKETLFRFLTK